MRIALGLFVSDCGLADELCDRYLSPDNSYAPRVEEPAYTATEGHAPLVVIDEAHHNLHTMDGRFKAFSDLLREDGYTVESSRGKYSALTKSALEQIDVLVIANALSSANLGRESCTDQWKLPTPSAFEEPEITALVEWIRGGGSLLLVADHMPFPGAAEKLAIELGVLMSNGYTYPVDIYKPMEFKRTEGSLRTHPITRGRAGKNEAVNSVFSFTGQAFRAKPLANLQPLMVLTAGVRTYFPRGPMAESPDFLRDLMASPSVLSEGMMQGAALDYGKGRVVILGEAGMFTAQEHGEILMGMNYPPAKDNAQFALNVVRWLSGLL